MLGENSSCAAYLVRLILSVTMVLKIYSEISLDKNMQHIAASQLVYIEIQFTGLCVMQAFTEGFFRKDFETAVVLWMPLNHSLGMVYVF